MCGDLDLWRAWSAVVSESQVLASGKTRDGLVAGLASEQDPIS